MNNYILDQIDLAKQRIEKVMNPIKGKIAVKIENNQHGLYETKIQVKGIKNLLFAKKQSKSPMKALMSTEDAIKKQIHKYRKSMNNY